MNALRSARLLDASIVESVDWNAKAPGTKGFRALLFALSASRSGNCLICFSANMPLAHPCSTL